MTNPSPRPALRKAEDAAIHPAAPRPARAARAPKPAPTAVEPAAASPAVPAPRTIADTNRDAVAAAEKRARKAKGKGRDRDTAAAEPAPAAGKAGRKKGKFSGSTSDHLRVQGTEFLEHPAPTKGRRKGAVAPAGTPAAPTTAPRAGKAKELMSGKVVDLGARVPKKLRAAAREEAKRRGLDIDAVTTELLYEWLTRRD
jgi:hypothetical protein